MDKIFNGINDNGCGLQGLLSIAAKAINAGERNGLLTAQDIGQLRQCVHTAAYTAGAAFTALGFERMDYGQIDDESAAASGLVLAGTLLTELAYLHESLDGAERSLKNRAAPPAAAESPM